MTNPYARAKEQGREVRAQGLAPGTRLGVHHLNVPAEQFLSQVMNGIAPLKGVRVERPSQSNVTIHHRYTPGWAIAVGILGLIVFLLGALLFFIKRTDTMSVIASDSAGGGCDVTVSGKAPMSVTQVLSRLVAANS